MTTVIKWVVEQLDVKPQEGDLTDVVIVCHWRCNGVDGQYSASVYGTCSFSQPGEPFVPYSNLTEQEILNWCWNSGVDKDATEANIDTQIANQVNPPIVTPPLPWSQP